MVYYSSIIYINNILKYFYFYIKCVSLFSFASFLFFFAYTGWIQIGYRLDTDWIQNVYICQKSVFMRLVAVLAALFFIVLLTTWQPKKTPAFQLGLNVYFFDALYQLRYCIVCIIF